MSNKIKESNISDSAVTESKIADNAITSAKIAPGAVVAADVGDGTITTAKIADANVTSGKIAADAIDGTKIADDAIDSEHITDGSVDNVHLAGSIANDKLTNSSITINGTSIALGASGDIVAGTDWQSVKTADFTAVASEGYFVDTSGGAVTMTMPASPSLGDEVNVVVITAGNDFTIARNGSNIDGTANDQVLTTDGDSKRYVYVNASEGWKTFQSTVAPTFIAATGGTTSTSGDYKIHSFTSSGCFVVSNTSNTPANNEVSYMVVAGGGSGGWGDGIHGGGGGGAGGFREGKSTVDSYSESPISASSGLTLTASTYPITVGAGGNASPGSYNNGSNSVFSTITSAGGGGGQASYSHSKPDAGDGGSGGGGSVDSRPDDYGAGNTPPVSPPQGQPGINAVSESLAGAGGGGGATQAGQQGTCGPGTSNGGNGGNGAPTSISGSSATYAGGGAGASRGCTTANATGGNGGGGNASPSVGTAGSTNTGGGGGTGHSGGANAGSGIVIIRYKYQ